MGRPDCDLPVLLPHLGAITQRSHDRRPRRLRIARPRQPEVDFKLTPASDLSHIVSDSVDHVFTSNFLEHLPDKAACDVVLKEVRRILKPGGKFMILGPNIRYVYKDIGTITITIWRCCIRRLVEGLMLAGYTPKS